MVLVNFAWEKHMTKPDINRINEEPDSGHYPSRFGRAAGIVALVGALGLGAFMSEQAIDHALHFNIPPISITPGQDR